MSLNVLIVDDEKMNLLLASKMIEHLGHTASTASSGAEALSILAKKSFDLMLLDILMPEVSGIETAQNIRAASDLGPMCDIPIYALTGLSQPEDAQRFKDAGMSGLVTKPIGLKTLADLLANH